MTIPQILQDCITHMYWFLFRFIPSKLPLSIGRFPFLSRYLHVLKGRTFLSDHSSNIAGLYYTHVLVLFRLTPSNYHLPKAASISSVEISMCSEKDSPHQPSLQYCRNILHTCFSSFQAYSFKIAVIFQR